MSSEIANFIASTAAKQQWSNFGVKHHHGICIPLFSLRSEKSGGIGEYEDLIPLIKWCGKVGFDIIQLLPLNDTGKGSSPYSAISAFALNPIHISLSSLPNWKSSAELNKIFEELQEHNQKQRIDYETIGRLKELFLRNYFQSIHSALQKSSDFQSFVKNNSWLKGFSLFKTLKTKANWYSWQDWPEEWKNPSNELIEKLINENLDEVEFHAYVQFLCYQQFTQVKKEAKKHGVLLKGDIPILINKDSADVWQHRDLFKLDYSAGAPPDMYSPEGQDWGFPLYNWEILEKQNYKWWIDRLKTAAFYYDLYRLDHIVGFYRIWAINLSEPGQPRGFFPHDPHTWIQHGEKIMRALIANCSMLPIGEDLGTVPNEVRANLRSLGICGTKVIRWERKWEEDKRYIPYAEYEPLSMTTVSTHDSETLKLWWKNNVEEAHEFSRFKGWEYEPQLSDEHHREILFDSHHTNSLFHISLLQEYLALVPSMTWDNPEDERINIPGTISPVNWSYKFRPSVEEITSQPALDTLIRNAIS